MEHDTQHLNLHYTSPASTWSEALPIGNGRLGAVVYGGTTTELFQLNEDSVWYGGPSDRTPKDALRNLSKLRQLIREERHAEVEALVSEAFFATPMSMRHYEPLGNCTIGYGHQEQDISDYQRRLDLSVSQVSVSYRHLGVSYQRDVIASSPDNIVILRHISSKPTRFVVRLNRIGEDKTETNNYVDDIDAYERRIVLYATPGGRNSNRLCLVVGISTNEGTKVEAIGDCLIVHSSSCMIAIGAQTTYRHADNERAARLDVDEALSKSWDELVNRHRSDYLKLFSRTSLRMWPDSSHLPTDERIKNNRDPGLVALYHNYGRYLLISSSRDSFRPLPANLQGIWNPSFAPPWGSKYTININIQMNYWPAARCSLVDDCAMPLLYLLELMAARGRETARVMYGCRGWCAHHNTDIWGDTSPQDRWMPATLWPLGGVWVAVEVVEMLHYQYSADLHNRLFPILEGAVQFLLDFLIPSACGQYLVTNPSLSPENVFISESGDKGIFCEGSVLDMTLTRMAFDHFLWSTEILGRLDHGLLSQVRHALSIMPPLKVNQQGLIQEWGLKDFEENEPGHRHVSHLFGLYPGESISQVKSPHLARAAEKVLQRRAAHGGGHTGWSRAWLLNLHARLFDSEGCDRHMDLLLERSTLPNLLDTHPPFQIDGNFGGCAGIIECLVQSTVLHRDGQTIAEIRLLPARPPSWSNGKLDRTRVKQGWLVSFEWVSGNIVEPVIVEATQRHSSANIVFPDGAEVFISDCALGKRLVYSKQDSAYVLYENS